MSLKAQLDNDIKAALLGGDRFRTDVLRTLKAAVLSEEVAKNKRDEGLGDAEFEQVVAREVKKRLDSVEQYTAAARPELAETEAAEAKILEIYLPEQLSEEDIKVAIDDTIGELNVSGMQAMGQVIGAVKGKLGNAADGATVARLVKEALS
ncbi:MAG TPA: GatB/YqeY domain-containing protein [Dongiaceae bacterium]|nr:GatB/YqeY domain-containing protein [Dongiaceae bacterium]